MRRTMLIYGLLAGGVVAITFVLSYFTTESGAGVPEWLGYLIMLIALSMIFVGIKRYRDCELGGTIAFKRALLLGVGISVVAGVVYVAAWEVHLAATDYAFVDDYTEAVMADKAASGLSEAELSQEAATMEKLKENYARPSYRLPITFLEIFPVGLLISLVAAALLRRSTFLPADG